MNADVTKNQRSQGSRTQIRRQGALIIAIPVTCLIISVLGIAWLRDNTLKARQQREESSQLLDQTNRMYRILVDAETGIRGYGLTNQPEFLEPYERAKINLPAAILELSALVEDEPQRQKPFQAIVRNEQQQIELLDKTRKLFATSKKNSKEQLQQLIKSKNQMDTLRQQIAEFVAQEERYQAQLQEQIDDWVKLTDAAQWAALMFGLLGAGMAWCLLDRLQKQLQIREGHLQESKTRIQAVVDNAADCMITLDEMGYIQSFNAAAEKIFGYSAAQITGKSLRLLLAESANRDTSSDLLNYFLLIENAKLSSCQRETTGRHQDGRTFPMELAISEMQLETERLFIAIGRDITERRQAEETLRNQAQLLDLANDTIIVRDLNNQITYWNQGARRMYGWKQREVIGQMTHALLQTEFPQPLPEIEQNLLAQGYWEGKLTHTTREGKKIIVASSWTLQRDEEGQPVAILEINNDITEQQQWVQALRDQEQMLQLVMNTIPQYIFWKDQDLVYRGCNENVARLLGLQSAAEIIGKTDYELPFSKQQAERYGALDRQVLETNQPSYHIVEQLWLPEMGNQPMWVDASKVPLTDGKGKAIGVLGAFEDITERKLAEMALAESERRFRDTFEQAAVGIAHVRLDGRWLRVNQKLCDIVGYSREEMLAQKFQDITHSDDLNADLALVKQLAAGEISSYSMEKRYIRKDGMPVWVNLTVSLTQDSAGESYMISAIEDITERKQGEEALVTRAAELTRTMGILAKTTGALKKRNQELDQFAYVVSHDLKAPLRAIANLSTWIEEDLVEVMTAETQRQMQLLRGRVHRMEALIEGLLQYSRVGRIKINLETVNVSKLLCDVIDSLPSKPNFRVEVDAQMPTLVTERLLLAQVFSNLISNGIKHHNKQAGTVKISVHEHGDFYEFTVADDGPGIAPQYHEKVFVIFSTLEARDKVENTGIGLSLVKKIVENQGGMIQLESQEGQGATFRFTWPKHPPALQEEKG